MNTQLLVRILKHLQVGRVPSPPFLFAINRATLLRRGLNQAATVIADPDVDGHIGAGVPVLSKAKTTLQLNLHHHQWPCASESKVEGAAIWPAFPEKSCSQGFMGLVGAVILYGLNANRFDLHEAPTVTHELRGLDGHRHSGGRLAAFGPDHKPIGLASCQIVY